MATDTAPPTAPARHRPTGNVWQLPVFVLGAAVFLAVWQGWVPLTARDPGAGFTRDLENLRAATERVPVDVPDLEAHLNRVAAAAESFPEHAPASHLALGTAYARLAELTADPARAA